MSGDGGLQPATAQTTRWRRITRSVWFQLALAFTVMALVLSFVAKPYVVPSESMDETLQAGDRVLVNRLAFAGSSPVPGDIVVFDADEAWDGDAPAAEDPLRSVLRWAGEVSGFGPSGRHTLVKRVIAGPGQVAACCTDDGAVTVDGVPLDEPYVFEDFPFEPGAVDCTSTPRSSRCFDSVTVPAESYLMLGDHRSGSSDSAARCRVVDADQDCWRWASRDGIVGKAVMILWPIPRWGLL
ncbi:signal peptidase I [Cryobacterium sp. 1639]|uniref:signal peptidase I n=1 Tax=Cryobacterium inferilacus TaxID=2866629 RepID=UPI001C736E0D|nr:signal peptidase I [Cryobacterium sp. 1639]MBX0301316.1 signal peptidase I [Cryobacterium sp. 1639]